MSNPSKPINPILLSAVIVLCLAACTLTLILPGESLIVDLIYQGF